MTPRETRLVRLANLRKQQHASAAATLRQAHGALAVEETLLDEGRQSAAKVRDVMVNSLTGPDEDDWVSACAHTELLHLYIAAQTNVRDAASRRVMDCARVESDARKNQEQMDVIVENLQRVQKLQRSRDEQRFLDEVARVPRPRHQTVGTNERII